MRLIPLDEIHKWLPQIEDILDRFIKDKPGYDYKQELHGVILGHYRTWEVGDNKTLIVTDLIFRPRPILWVKWLVGVDADSWGPDLYESLVDHAKKCGCEAIEFGVRDGFKRSKWAKKYSDMVHVADYYRIDLRDK